MRCKADDKITPSVILAGMTALSARFCLTSLLLALAVWATPVASAADEPQAQEQLRDIVGEIAREREEMLALEAEARALREDAHALQQASVALAREMRQLERDTEDLRFALAALHIEERRSSAGLERDRDRLVGTLAALQRIALQPPEVALTRPSGTLDTLRGSLLLGHAIPVLERRAGRLQGNLDTLAALRAETETQRDRLSEKSRHLDGKRRELAALLSRKQVIAAATQARRQESDQRLAELAEQAETLRELMDRLEEEARREQARQEAARRQRDAAAQAVAERVRQGETPAAQTGPTATQSDRQSTLAALTLERPTNLRPFPEERGTLVLPANGRIARSFDEPAPGGSTELSRGIVIATRAEATILAPFDGKIVFAGPFRGYGLILIIEHDERYHSLLAGFHRLNAVVGQWVLAGEPVGVVSSTGERSPELYLELRSAGEPVDPLPWFPNNSDKARG
jgi:septal ring factor EnvC (AmiA/AmiB activator)